MYVPVCVHNSMLGIFFNVLLSYCFFKIGSLVVQGAHLGQADWLVSSRDSNVSTSLGLGWQVLHCPVPCLCVPAGDEP